MRNLIVVCSAFALACAGVAQQGSKNGADVRINQIQVIGSHNSYHAGLTSSVKAVLEASNPKALRGLDYGHPPIPQQLDAGIRQIEIDVFTDSKGGLYSHPASERVLAAMKLPPDPPYNTDGSMDKAGLKVMHVPDLDQHSTCTPLIQCLQDVRAWSKAHPQHVPLFILLEAKAGKPIAMPGAVTPEPFTPAVFDALDAEVRSVFSADETITPDQVRGTHATLPQAIADGGWPLLSQSRGKVIFLLDNRALTPVYAEGHPALKGRALFTNSNPGDADAAFVEQNDGTKKAIDALVKQGYLIRTRADADKEEARSNSTARRDQAIASGAQLISTDYPKSEPAKWPGAYVVALPQDAVVRCNPVNAPHDCHLDK
jgi:hypothetical protein